MQKVELFIAQRISNSKLQVQPLQFELHHKGTKLKCGIVFKSPMNHKNRGSKNMMKSKYKTRWKFCIATLITKTGESNIFYDDSLSYFSFR